ncbi:MAG: phosphatase family protein [Thermoleophilia bacterium]|nr:phosphatase family protein [Thermoleophilia bacterium]
MQLSPLQAHTRAAIPFGPSAAVAASGSTTPMPSARLDVPVGIRDALTGAVERGVHEASAWIAANPAGTVEQLQAFVLAGVGAPPIGAALEADRAAVRRAVASRTPAQDETAVWIDEYGLFPPWQPTIDAYVAKVGADQARAGLGLLERTKELTGLLTFPVKDRYLRERPFQANADIPLLDGVTHVRGGSFPSGHASLAYAHSLVLGTLLPEHAGDSRATADQLAYARTYAAAHYPSDIVSGAYIGAVAATYAAARPDAVIPDRPIG